MIWVDLLNETLIWKGLTNSNKFRVKWNFNDDLSRYVYIHLMKRWSEKFDEFKQVRNEVEK